MRKGSIAVRAGDIVKAGQPLGMVGLSGYTEFAHLHFELRHRGRIVDPFVGEGDAEPCKPGANPLPPAQGAIPFWTPQALAAMAYLPSGVLGAGLAGDRPKLENSQVDPAGLEPFSARSRAAVFWVHVYGVQAGDVEEHRFIGPSGATLFERRRTVERNQAQLLSLVGGRMPGGVPWPSGSYRGEYVLYRGNPEAKVLSLTREISIPKR
jgi:hypothetical protein